ncbi:F-box domain cyclin-like protein [Neofusicoccum parvum]|nr:F-box domain cyclin-like protein [Neofusicoccum parvum]
MSNPANLPINPATATEEELESFRRQWREEVSARSRHQSFLAAAQRPAPASSSKPHPSHRNKAPVIPETPRDAHDGHDDAEQHAYHDLDEKHSGRKLADPAPAPTGVPVSALEHYEEAVRRETQGKLGDSVNLYRKAFKLDAAVQDIYKKKHFPAAAFSSQKPANANPSNASATVPNTAHHSLDGSSSNITDLVSSFASLAIPGEDPPTDLSPPPPCPIAELPEELLADILMYVALDDVAQFARLSQVCKRMAYLVLTEDRVWRRLALGSEFGFAAMHYKWACQLDGNPLGDDGEGGRFLSSYTGLPDPEEEEEREEVAARSRLLESALHTLPLVPDPYPSFRALFRSRPRIRFNGCYISTVNYTRPEHPVDPLLWPSSSSSSSPSTPAEAIADTGAIPNADTHQPPSSLDSALSPAETEGIVHVETAGVTPKYIYRLALAMGNAGKQARNNKLAWQGYWSYNRLTDDWGEFGLKNDKPFYWSRVKSWR